MSENIFSNKHLFKESAAQDTALDLWSARCFTEVHSGRPHTESPFISNKGASGLTAGPGYPLQLNGCRPQAAAV
jgi:hypothetical protein